MTKKRLTLLPALIAWLIATAFTTAPVAAEITNPVIGPLGEGAAEAESGSTFQNYFIVIWQAIISIVAVMLIIYLVWGAVEWITSAGDSGKVQKARDKMTQAVIGIVVLASVLAIFQIVQILLGVEFFTFDTGGGGGAPLWNPFGWGSV